MNPEVNTKVLELSTIYEISKTLTSTLNLKESFNSAMYILDKFLDMKHGTVVLYNNRTQELYPFFALGMREGKPKSYRVGEGIIGKVFKTGSPIIVPDVANEPALMDQITLNDNGEKSSYICVPIKTGDKVMGTLGVAFYRDKVSFSMEGGVKIVSMIASLIGQRLELSRMIDKEREQLIQEKKSLHHQLKVRHSLENVIGQSDKMQEVFETVHRVAASTATAFLRGESGTGKELIARAIHYNSTRAKGPFVKINCMALPETLLESELFGHEKGSFTGATYERKGRFELADGGTIFLDEIGDITVSIQMKLLRVLQERKFERLGSSKTISVDVRVIAATNQDLEEGIAKGTFREDLYYRLNVIPIFLPSLREREEDITILAEHFLEKFNKENLKNVGLSDEVMDFMLNYSWPGNVRQLENCMERLVIMADREIVTVEDLPYEIRTFGKQLPDKRLLDLETTEIKNAPGNSNSSLTKKVKEMERERILEALRKCGWVKSRAAKLLGITARQLTYRIDRYGIEGQKPWEEM